MQDLRSIQIADAGNGPLIQQPNLIARRLAPSRSLRISGVTAIASGPILSSPNCRSNSFGETSRTEPSPPPIPIQQFADLASSKSQPETQVFEIWGLGH